MKTVNSKLVCVALTGYGLDGSHANRPAYDYVIQAMTGVMSLTGDPTAPPTKAGYSAVDNSAGLVAAVPEGFCFSTSVAAAKYPCSRRKRPIACRTVTS